MNRYIMLYALLAVVLSLAGCARDSTLEKAPPPSANARPLGNAGAIKPHIGAAQPTNIRTPSSTGGQAATGGQ